MPAAQAVMGWGRGDETEVGADAGRTGPSSRNNRPISGLALVCALEEVEDQRGFSELGSPAASSVLPVPVWLPSKDCDGP